MNSFRAGGAGLLIPGVQVLQTLPGDDVNQPLTVYGLNGWSTANFYQSAANGVPDTPATFGLLYTADSAMSAVAFVFNCMTAAGTQGWSLGHDNTGAPTVRMYDGATADQVIAAVVKANANTVHAIAATYDGTTLKFYVDGMRIGQITITAYSAPGATIRTAIGKSIVSGFPSDKLTVLGGATSTAVMSDAQILAWCDACAALGDVAPFASGTDYLYSVKQSAQSVPATWPSLASVQDLTKNGTLALNTIANAGFAFNTDALLTTRLYGLIRIMLWGDSITSGVGSSTNDGYRDNLYDSLVAAGSFAVDLIGPFSSGTGNDTNHNGIAGSRIESFNTGGANDVAVRIGAGKLYHPQITVLMLGANHSGSDADRDAAPGLLQSLVEYARSLEPRLRFVLCHVSVNSAADVQARRAVINAAIHSTVMPALLAQSIPVVECTATGTALDPLTDLTDTTHPNDGGYVKLAAAIYPKVRLAAGWPETP